MSESRPPDRPAPMEGRGKYGRSSAVQAGGLMPAVPLLEEAARQVPVPAGSSPVVIADYGVSSGVNSLIPIGLALTRLRERIGVTRELSVVHTDLPGNDFGALFRLLEQDPGSYLRQDPAVFASAVGRSFYEQVLPTASVTLGWSSWAVQWLSRIPASIPDQIQIAYSRDDSVRALFLNQAADDWQRFLRHRSRELVPGGRMILLTMATDERGFGYEPLVQADYRAILRMVEDRLIEPEEARRMVIPTVGRTRAQLLAPFDPEGRFEGLVVDRVEVFQARDEFWAQYERDRDAEAFGLRWAAFSRASVGPTLALGLRGGLEDPRAGEFLARLESDAARELAASPQPMHIPLATVSLLKTER